MRTWTLAALLSGLVMIWSGARGDVAGTIVGSTLFLTSVHLGTTGIRR